MRACKWLNAITLALCVLILAPLGCKERREKREVEVKTPDREVEVEVETTTRDRDD